MPIAAIVGLATFLALSVGQPDKRESASTLSLGRSTGSTPPIAHATPHPGAITSIGASIEDWQAAHPADPSHLDGCCYFGPLSGFDRYVSVHRTDGRVVAYDLRFVSPIPSQAAVLEAERELPQDARVTRALSGSESCLGMEFQSESLAAALRTNRVDEAAGRVIVKLRSVGNHLEPSRISTVEIALSPGSAESASNC